MDTTRAKAYSRAKVQLTLTELAASILIVAVIAFTPVGGALAQIAVRMGSNDYVRFLAFTVLYGLAISLPTAPLSFFSGYVLEHRYELSNESVWQWLVRRLKMLAVGAAIGLPLALVFYACLRHFAFWWWVPVGLAFFAVSLVLAQLAPVLIFPLFYKFRPVELAALQRRLERLFQKAGLQLQGLYEFDMSRETRKANAALTGLGKTRRILLGDTLLQTLDEEEIEAVVAHELGHHVHKHIWKMLVLGFVVELGGLALTALGHQVWLQAHGLPQTWDLRGLPFLFFLLALYGQLVSPIVSAVSRRQERQADRFALEHVEHPQVLASALRKLESQNLEDPDPPQWVVWLFHDHPPISERVQEAESFGREREQERRLRSQMVEPA